MTLLSVARVLGAVEVLYKPFGPTELLAALPSVPSDSVEAVHT